MAESDSKKEQTEDCATAAMTYYGKANDAPVQQTATVMSVEATTVHPVPRQTQKAIGCFPAGGGRARASHARSGCL
jgi:hypothetical protein